MPKVPRLTKQAGGLQWLGFVDAVALVCQRKRVDEDEATETLLVLNEQGDIRFRPRRLVIDWFWMFGIGPRAFVDRVEQFEPGAGRKALALYEVDARELKSWLDKAGISAASPAARDKPKRRG